jgi:hypothetical protein
MGDYYFHRVFIDFHTRQVVVVKEHCAQISAGTTGLACWQAAATLSEFFRQYLMADHGLDDTQPLRPAPPIRHVLELGCGCGLVGLAAMRYFPQLESITFTDHSADVLALVAENVRLNHPAASREGNKDDSLHVNITRLDWSNYELSDLAIVPDTVIAAGEFEPGLSPCSALAQPLPSQRRISKFQMSSTIVPFCQHCARSLPTCYE